MSSQNVGIEEARKTLGDLVTAAQQGTAITITRNGRPAAHIAAGPAPRRDRPAYPLYSYNTLRHVELHVEADSLDPELVGQYRRRRSICDTLINAENAAIQAGREIDERINNLSDDPADDTAANALLCEYEVVRAQVDGLREALARWQDALEQDAAEIMEASDCDCDW